MKDPKGINIAILPKEKFPLKRVRLTELFMKEFTAKDNTIHWILETEQKRRSKKRKEKMKRNTFLLLYNGYSNFFHKNLNSVYLRFKKMKNLAEVIKGNEIDLLLANDGIIEGLLVLYYSRKHRIPCAFYLSSFFYDMEKNNFRSERSLFNFLKVINELIKIPFLKIIIKRSDIFHPISKEMGIYFKEKYKLKNKILPLPLCPKEEFISYIPLQEDRDEIRDIYTMIYVGQITPVRKVEMYLEVLKKLIRDRENPTIMMLFVGPIFKNNYKKKLLQTIEDMELNDHVTMIDEVPIDTIPSYIENADLGLCLLPPIRSYIISSPTKIVEYLSLGVPVVANNEIVDQKIIIKSSGGGLLSSYDSDKIAEKIGKMIKDYTKGRSMGKKGKEWIIENRNYEIIASELIGFYRSFLVEYRSE